MADQSISQLGVATALTGTELTVVVQGGVTKQTQVQDIANLGGGGVPAGPLGSVAVGDGTGLDYTAIGTAGQVLTSNGAATPTFQTPAIPPIPLNQIVISANTAIPSNYNGVSLGPITVNPGVTVTIASGSSWQIN
jgi:hypothetical protein